MVRKKIGKRSRWLEIAATSPSGRSLFVCIVCGRVSQTADWKCKTVPTFSTGGTAEHPYEGMSCEQVEELETNEIVQEVPFNSIPPSTVDVGSRKEDRLKVANYIHHLFLVSLNDDDFVHRLTTFIGILKDH